MSEPSEQADIDQAFDHLFETLKTKETDKGIAFYELGEEVGNDRDNLITRTDKSKYLTDNEVEAVKRDSQNFADKALAIENNKLPKREQLVVLNRLPSAYNNIPELAGKKLLMTQDVYKKIGTLPNKFGKNHNVPFEREVKIPSLVADPNYILQSNAKGHEDRFVIVTNSIGSKQGERLSIIIQPARDNLVVSGYDEYINISEEKKYGRVLFDKKKELETKSTALNAVDDSSPFKDNVPQKSDIVNSTFHQTGDRVKKEELPVAGGGLNFGTYDKQNPENKIFRVMGEYRAWENTGGKMSKIICSRRQNRRFSAFRQHSFCERGRHIHNIDI